MVVCVAIDVHIFSGPAPHQDDSGRYGQHADERTYPRSEKSENRTLANLRKADRTSTALDAPPRARAWRAYGATEDLFLQIVETLGNSNSAAKFEALQSQ